MRERTCGECVKFAPTKTLRDGRLVLGRCVFDHHTDANAPACRRHFVLKEEHRALDRQRR